MKKPNPFSFLSMVLLISGLAITFSAPEAVSQTNGQATSIVPDTKVQVISAASLRKNRGHHSAVLGDLIAVKINNLDYLLSAADTCCNRMADTLIVLSLNGMPCSDIPVVSLNRATNTIIFHLDRNAETLKKIGKLFSYPWDEIILSRVSICISGSPPLPTRVEEFMLRCSSRWTLYSALILIAVILGSFVLLVKFTNLLRVGRDDSPYSLAQTQLGFWTVLVAASVLYIWITTTNLPELSPATLALLGISIATTAGGKLVTYARQENPPANVKTEGFIKDILSDSNSVTMPRFQMFLWTLILGFIFIQKVIYYQQIPEFSETYLVLTGISSGAYVLLKTVESRDQTNTTPGGTGIAEKTDQTKAMG
jgi:hypothetical protein